VVEQGDHELVIRVTGEVINDCQVKLTALVDGQAIRIETALCARVETGQVLAAIDNQAAAASRQRAQAYLQQEDVRRRQNRLAQLRARYIGYIFQSFNLIPTRNALENVALPLLYQGGSVCP
jgi:multidrug efflux pump subunit AcrA (membrane-fusion protein)